MQKLATLMLTVVLFVWGCTSDTHDGYTINGTIKGLDKDTISMQYQVGDSMSVDSADVDNGSFTFTGEVPHASKAMIRVDGSKRLELYIENSDISIQAHADSLSQATITGSGAQKQYEQLQELQAILDKQMQEIRNKQRKAQKEGNNQRLKELQSQASSLYAEKKENIKEFIKNNPSSFVSLQNMQRIIPSNGYRELYPLYDSLSEELKSSELGQQIGEIMKAKKQTQVGAQAPDFTLDNLGGEAVSLSSYQDQYVLVDFWAAWCKPCREEHPNYIEAYEKYNDQNFTILSVSLDKEREDWVEAVKEDEMTWTQVSNLEGFQGEVAIRYAIRAIPQNFLINPDGEIVAKNLRGEELHQKLQEML